MWRKPLARRTRWSYGFCLGDSRFVLRLQGLTVRVTEFGRGLSISLQAREQGIFRMRSAELGGIEARRDTPGERAGTLEVWSGMDRGSGRIKGWTP
jgi:hypothetical protein